MTGTILVQGLNLYVLVFCRMGGMIFFNPLLSRRNVPSQARVALALGLTLLLAPTVSTALPENLSQLALLMLMCKELFIGFACGLVFQMFYYMLFAAGDIIDMGFGLSMAKAFDPGTNIQISMTGNIFQVVFVLYFFATNSHLIFIRLMASSYSLVEVGGAVIGEGIAQFLMQTFALSFSLVLHLSLPFIAASFVLEIAMGVLMKLIPQINVFSVHFQTKIIFGLVLLFLFAGPTAAFLQNYISLMLKTMQNVFAAV